MTWSALVRGGHKVVRIGGIEFEHFEVAGNDETSTDIACQFRGLPPVQVSSNTTFGPGSVDREESDIDREVPQVFGHFGITNGIAAMINGPPAELDDVAEKFAPALFVAFDSLVSGG